MLGGRHRGEGSFLLKQSTDCVLPEEKACNVGTAEIHSLVSYVSFALSRERRGKTAYNYFVRQNICILLNGKKEQKKIGKKMFAIIQ